MSIVVENTTQVAKKRHSMAIEKGSRIATVTLELNMTPRDAAEARARRMVEETWRKEFGALLPGRDCPVFTTVHSAGSIIVELVVGP